MKCRSVLVVLVVAAFVVVAFGGAMIQTGPDQRDSIPVAQSALIAWGLDYNQGNRAGTHPPWWAQSLAYGGVTIGCGFIGLGASMAATPMVGFSVGSVCDIGISA